MEQAPLARIFVHLAIVDAFATGDNVFAQELLDSLDTDADGDHELVINEINTLPVNFLNVGFVDYRWRERQ